MTDQTAIPPPVYRKLTRLHRGVGTMSRLWLGPDHLLHVNSTGYTENYRRCYLRDIQSMLIVHTGRRTYIALILAVLMGIVALILRYNFSGWTGYAILAGVFLPLFLWNHLLGAGCRVVVITAVQQERIPSLCRLPKTRRVVAELTPLIEAAQAELGSPGQPEATAATEPPLVPSVKAAMVLPPPLPPPLAPS